MKRSPPVTYDTIRRIGLEFPNAEESTSYGTPALKVRGKLFVRWREDDDPDTIVVKMPFDQREELMAAEPGTYFITDHYRNYPWILVRLSKIHPDAIHELLQIGYREALPVARPAAKRRPRPRA
ncbi:MAG: MmcQ/YjbR family DNA-binding protein [Candidatus Acidiferrales bacterium]